ncbi:HIT family protein [Streptomyces sp. NPDC057249]|uniref:HIT family protein n=1 Tax=Streptomyces sp. NPDC057249 TaxID=3346067 RepID=UPI003624E707
MLTPGDQTEEESLVAADRRPMDLDAYEARVRNGPCFICAFVAGEPGHVTVYEDDQHIAFLDRYPTVPGKVLVAPKTHIEHAPSATLRSPPISR